MRDLLLLGLMPLAACTTVAPAVPVAPAAACSPVTLGQFVGQRRGTDLQARMLKLTGKSAIRWVEPGMMVTMDFSENRLTVYLDAAGRVERVSCS
jgi:hypothetical protein